MWLFKNLKRDQEAINKDINEISKTAGGLIKRIIHHKAKYHYELGVEDKKALQQTIDSLEHVKSNCRII